MTLRFVIVAAVLAAFASAPARAETTKELLDLCKADTKKCENTIIAVAVMMEIDKTKRAAYCLPNGFSSAAVTKTIVDWLSQRPELGGEASTPTVEKAFLAKYPATKACNDTYVREDIFPASTAAFLAYCAAEPKNVKETCYDDIAGVGLKLSIDERDKVCLMKSDPLDKKAFHEEMVERDTAIRAWLREHTELADKPHRDSIAAAYAALYGPPCADIAATPAPVSEQRKKMLEKLCPAKAASPKECDAAGIKY